MCHNIDTAALRIYSDKRKEIIGHTPTQSTIATHNSALNYLFRKAKEKNFIQFIPKTINDGVEGKRRPYFNDKEMKKLNANMWRYLKHSEKLLNQKGRNGIENISQKTYWIRELLRDVVLILVNTGMRPGSEILSLKWKNLSITKQHGMESIQFSLPHSKTKRRVVIGYEPFVREDGVKYGCWKPLENIKNKFDNLKDLDWNKLFESDEYIFRYPNGELAVQEQLTKAFKRMLKWIQVDGKEDGLLRDDFGEERTLYSLRHTYASRMRYKGISFDDLSVQMGTSVKMLEQHYSHFKVSDNPNKFAGHELRATREKQKAKEEDSSMMKQLVEQNQQMKQLLEKLLDKR
ncbi:Phage integrase family protein [Desulfuromusa kysingii]|uniref:Phage integrase family protein n=1 Tax=Desulfuromusa kysingii TaxID=37625 RepID=A0A1H4EK51_9BACT|nr:tyrosine-type recombinase/integrase [Desulfuromusa kysingii]SEA84960.1 Phage integrase family protein [Desulfuromusa kysingii]